MKNIPAHFKLKIRGLGNGSHPVDISVPAEDLDIPMFQDRVHAEGTLAVSDRLELHLGLRAAGNFICDRCGIEFERTLEPHLDLLYVPPQLSKDAEEDDNIHTFDPQTTNEIDFTNDVRDALLLAIPMKILHSPDCKGIELGAAEIQIDDRLASLGNLYDKLREEEMKDSESKATK
jgi:uncharacterized protein